MQIRSCRRIRSQHRSPVTTELHKEDSLAARRGVHSSRRRPATLPHVRRAHPFHQPINPAGAHPAAPPPSFSPHARAPLASGNTASPTIATCGHRAGLANITTHGPRTPGCASLTRWRRPALLLTGRRGAVRRRPLAAAHPAAVSTACLGSPCGTRWRRSGTRSLRGLHADRPPCHHSQS